MKILLGEISSYKSIVIAKFLKETYPEFIILGNDYKKFTKYISTRYCSSVLLVENPKRDKQKHIQTLSTIIKSNKIDLFIPVDSSMYGEYIKNKKLFGDAFSYVGEYSIYDKLHDKSKSQALAKILAIRIPKFYANIENSKIPFVIKPINQSSAKGVKYITSENQRTKVKLDSDKLFVYQEYVKGIGCGYSVFAKNGEIITGGGHIRLAELPISGGSSVYRANYYNEEMIAIAKKILKNTNWSGFAMFEFKLTPENEIVLIEVNPRIWGSINQGLQNGVNYFESLFGNKTIQTKREIKTYLSPAISISFFKYFFNFQFKPILTFLKNTRYNSVDVRFFNDPFGYLSMILRKLS